MVRKQVFEALERAIKSELEGAWFYTMAAEATQDSRGREVFTVLAQEERSHAEHLQGQWRALKEQGELDRELKLPEPTRLPKDNPIFSEALLERIKGAHYEMTALSVGIQLESDSQRFYREQAEAAEDPGIKSLFRLLAEWESSHYHALLNQQRMLEEDYWAANRFAPF